MKKIFAPILGARGGTSVHVESEPPKVVSVPAEAIRITSDVRRREHYNRFMKRLSAASVLCLTQACSLAGPGTAISDFKEGLIRFNDSGAPELTNLGNDFVYRENGQCVVAGTRQACMWYGFSFNYESSEDQVDLKCLTAIDPPSTVVDPRSSTPTKVSTFAWTLVLKGRTGHYVHPQYLAGNPNEEAPVNSYKTSCSHRGVEVLKFEITIRRSSAVPHAASTSGSPRAGA